MDCNVFCRIKDKRKIMILESREKRKVEKPKLPRTAKKLDTNRMKGEMEELGVEVEDQGDVSI